MTATKQAVVLAALACSSAAAAEILVIRSSSPSFYTGQRLPDRQPMNLSRGEELLVLRGGQTRRYCGPGSFRFDQAASNGGCRAGSVGGARTGALSSTQLGGARNPGLLILRSAGPSVGRYRVGTRIAPTTRLELRAGDSVTLLQPRGPRLFQGPGTFNASAVFAPRRRFSAVRPGATPPAAPPPPMTAPRDLWHIDPAQSGAICVRQGSSPLLWRADTAAAAQVTITSPTGGETSLEWRVGESTAPWPAALTLDEGATYTLSGPDHGNPTQVTVRLVPALDETDRDLVASTLLALECRSQLDILIATAATATDPGGAQDDAEAGRPDEDRD